jgi:hypothetical protein
MAVEFEQMHRECKELVSGKMSPKDEEGTESHRPMQQRARRLKAKRGL